MARLIRRNEISSNGSLRPAARRGGVGLSMGTKSGLPLFKMRERKNKCFFRPGSFLRFCLTGISFGPKLKTGTGP
ncbi:hypothetical protein KSP40_PGU011369 [Platanthera guangdongensis]|uniref:Uncharacterized protein n=1 Tax=Platanthera guangdongensis TaxID=2320717 RepID=A0ABR2LKQ3_9ASPA